MPLSVAAGRFDCVIVSYVITKVIIQQCTKLDWQCLIKMTSGKKPVKQQLKHTGWWTERIRSYARWLIIKTMFATTVPFEACCQRHKMVQQGCEMIMATRRTVAVLRNLYCTLWPREHTTHQNEHITYSGRVLVVPSGSADITENECYDFEETNEVQVQPAFDPCILINQFTLALAAKYNVMSWTEGVTVLSVLATLGHFLR